MRDRYISVLDNTQVELVGRDEDSGWPVVEWITGNGSSYIVAVDPFMFDSQFTPFQEGIHDNPI